MNLITGASGFLGGHLVEALAARGLPARAMVRNSIRAALLRKTRGVEVVEGDLTDPASLDAATRGVERVFHCAAHAVDFGPWATFRAANVAGVAALLRSAERAGVRRFVHVSTTDVYGHPDRPTDEGGALRNRNWPYGDTKIAGENLVWAAQRASGLPVTVIRPCSIYGPRSTSLVLEVVKLLKTGQMVHIAGGRRVAGLAYVTNVVDLMLLAADAPAAVGQAYNAADGTQHTWREYVERLADILGVRRPSISIPRSVAYAAGWSMERTIGALLPHRRPLLSRMAVEIFGTHQDFPIEKARRELGYQPAVDFDDGMRRVEQWLREAGEL